MELYISPLPHLFSVFIFLAYLMYFTKKVSKELRSTSFICQEKHLRRKKIILTFMLFLTLISTLAYNTFAAFIGCRKSILMYRSANTNEIYEILKYLEIFSETILKSSLFFSLIILLPLVNSRTPNEKIKFLYFYSFVRIPLYLLILMLLKDYQYFKMFVLEILQISDAYLLVTLFMEICIKKKVVEDFNLIETYEHEYIYLKVIKKCKIIIVEILLEILSRSFLIYIMVSQVSNTILYMTLLYIIKVMYMQFMIKSMISVIFCKEQEMFNNLINFTEVKEELNKRKL